MRVGRRRDVEQPFTPNGFGNWFKRRCREAGLDHCSAHGLRKAGATIAAEHGASERQLMAIFGWSNPKQAAHYTTKAEQKRLAGGAMHLIDVGEIENVKGPTANVVEERWEPEAEKFSNINGASK